MLVRSQAIVVGLGQGLNQLISLVRNLFFAKFLPIDEFAIAGVYLLLASAMEMVNDIHLDKYMISREGAIRKQYLSSLYTINLYKGAALTALLILVYVALETLNVNFTISGFLFFCFIPLLISCSNIKVKYYQRFGLHVPNYAIEVGSQVLATIAALVAFNYYANSLSVLVGIVTLYLSKPLLSFLIFKAPTIDLGINLFRFKSLSHFSMPLWINNLLLFIVIQGDRILVTSFSELSKIAVYTLAFTLGFGLYGFFSRSSIQLMLPICSRAKSLAKSKIYNKLNWAFNLLALVAAIVVVLSSSSFLTIVGDEYLKFEELFVVSLFTFIIKIPKICYNIILTVERQPTFIMYASKFKLYQTIFLIPLFYMGCDLTWLLMFSVFSEALITCYLVLKVNNEINAVWLSYVAPFLLLFFVIAYLCV